MEVGEFGVFPAEFDDDVDFGVKAPGRFRAGDDFLDEGDSHGARSCQAAGAGDCGVDFEAGVGLGDVGEEAGEFGAYIGVVAPVVGEEDCLAVEDDRFDGGRADVDPEIAGMLGRRHVARGLRLLHRFPSGIFLTLETRRIRKNFQHEEIRIGEQGDLPPQALNPGLLTFPQRGRQARQESGVLKTSQGNTRH